MVPAFVITPATEVSRFTPAEKVGGTSAQDNDIMLLMLGWCCIVGLMRACGLVFAYHTALSVNYGVSDCSKVRWRAERRCLTL